MLFRRLLLLLPASALLLLTAQSAFACSCGPRPSLLESFDYSDEVVIVRAVSVEKVENALNRYYVHGVKSTTMVVERVFKGHLKVSEQIVFGQGSGADCIWTFSESSIGEQYLLYLGRPDEQPTNDPPLSLRDPSLWVAFGCGRSTSVEGAAGDLQYLENMSKVKGKTRISGTLDARPESGIDFAGKTVRIIGSKKVYKTKTNKNGGFEIYDLPPGKYFVEPEIPRGWKIDVSHLMYLFRVMGHEDFSQRQNEWQKRVELTLEPKKQADVDFRFIPDNFVRGRVLGPKGIPMPGVCVFLLRPGEDEWGPSDCTDEQGRFEIKSVPKGDHVLVANRYGKPSTREPFKKIFYPNVAERERAAIINVDPGETLEDVDIVISQLVETITIEGVLRYADGKPVVGDYVDFKVANPEQRLEGNATAQTDNEGRFKLTVLKGLQGALQSDVWLRPDSYKNCPKLAEFIAKSGKDSTRFFSNKIELTTEQNLYNVEITMPFSLCENR